MRRTACLTALLAAVLATGSGFAQTYPQRAVRIIVPLAPGGGTDNLTRIIAPKLADILGQQFVVENRAGAGGQIGSDFVAKSPADGYTLLTTSSSQATNATLYSKLPYDSIRDFTPVSAIGVSPLVLAANPTLPIKSVADLIGAARAKPGALMYPSAGTGNSTHLGGELFAAMANVTLTHVPYKGLGPGLVDLMAGRLQIVFSTAPSAIPHIKTSRLRGLAVTTAARSNLLPQLPTVAESGVPGYESGSWYGIIGPAGVPRTVVARLNTEITAVLGTAEFREQLMAAGADPMTTTPEQFAAYIKTEIAKWAKVIKLDRKSTRLNSSHVALSRMPSSA